MLRIRTLRVRPYSGYSYQRILLEQARAHTRARDGEKRDRRGKKRGESAGNARSEARVARGKPIGRSSLGRALKTHMKSTRDARGRRCWKTTNSLLKNY